MNDTRRKRIKALQEQADAIRAALEEIRDEERDTFDNMPEGLQQTANGQKSEAAADALDEAVNHLEELDNALSTATE